MRHAPHAAVRREQVGVEALDRHISGVPLAQVHLSIAANPQQAHRLCAAGEEQQTGGEQEQCVVGGASKLREEQQPGKEGSTTVAGGPVRGGRINKEQERGAPHQQGANKRG
jgi:hypothetical protein